MPDHFQHVEDKNGNFKRLRRCRKGDVGKVFVEGLQVKKNAFERAVRGLWNGAVQSGFWLYTAVVLLFLYLVTKIKLYQDFPASSSKKIKNHVSAAEIEESYNLGNKNHGTAETELNRVNRLRKQEAKKARLSVKKGNRREIVENEREAAEFFQHQENEQQREELLEGEGDTVSNTKTCQPVVPVAKEVSGSTEKSEKSQQATSSGEQITETTSGMQIEMQDPYIESEEQSLLRVLCNPVLKQEIARQVEQELAGQETARRETARQETARQETARQEAARQEAEQQAFARREAAAKQEVAKQEAARQEAARQQAERQKAAKLEDAKRAVAIREVRESIPTSPEDKAEDSGYTSPTVSDSEQYINPVGTSLLRPTAVAFKPAVEETTTAAIYPHPILLLRKQLGSS